MAKVNKNRGYKLTPRRRAIAIEIVRQYPQDLRSRADILHGSPPHAGAGAKGGHSDPTAARALRYASIEKRISAVEKALEKIPPEYHKGVLDNVIFKIGRERLEESGFAGSATWQRQRERFLFYVALFAKVR